jgi:hypothetical protein
MVSSGIYQEQQGSDKLPFQPLRRGSLYQEDDHFHQEEEEDEEDDDFVFQPPKRLVSVYVRSERGSNGISNKNTIHRSALNDFAVRVPQRQESLDTMPPVRCILLGEPPASPKFDEIRLTPPRRKESLEAGARRSSSVSTLGWSMSWSKLSLSDLGTIAESHRSASNPSCGEDGNENEFLTR